MRRPEEITPITNGFDREDLQRAQDRADTHADNIRKDADCLFLAAGAFYGRRELACLVEPLREVIDRRPEWQGRVRLVVAGRLDAQQERYWRSACPPWMELAGYRDHDTIVRWIRQADCNVAMIPDCRHARRCIPGKIFELLALPTHVLALVPPGSETETIIRQAGAATCAAMNRRAAVTEAIRQIIAQCVDDRLPQQREWACLDCYDRARIAADFSRQLRCLVHPR
jgi:hypothetical protein